MSGRIGISLKWAFFLFLLSFVLQFVVAFIYATVMAIAGFDQAYITANVEIVTVIIASLVLLPFVYIFCIKAAQEAYRKNVLGPKQKGINITITVVAFTVLMNVIVTYLLSGTFDIKFGLLPIIVAFIAGQKADSKH